MATFTTSDGLELYYEDAGTGRPLLCLAGLTRNCRDFDPLGTALAAAGDPVRLIRMDYRGRGRSDRDPDPKNYNVIRETGDAVELLDHLGLERATVLGTSRGGLIAMAMAAIHPGRMNGAILNDVGPAISAEGIARIMDYVGKPPEARSIEEAASMMADNLGPQFPGLSPDTWLAQARAQFLETPDGLVLNYDPALAEALAAQAAEGGTPDLWPFFDALAQYPLGVLRGANSDLLTVETLAEMQARNPALRAATVPDRGHVPLLDEPESLALIRKILEMVE